MSTAPERYGVVLLLIVLSLVVESLRGLVPGATTVRLALAVLTLLAVLRTTRPSRRLRPADGALAVAVLLAGVPADYVGPVDTRLAWSGAVMAAVLVVQMVLVGRRLGTHRTVTLSTAAALLQLHDADDDRLRRPRTGHRPGPDERRPRGAQRAAVPRDRGRRRHRQPPGAPSRSMT